MLGEPEYNMNELFAQLGLDSSDAAIDSFIENNQLDKEEKLIEASIWTDNQRAFLQEEWEKDAEWVEVIDDLNVRMHPDAKNQLLKKELLNKNPQTL
ncbi:LOW QUALITY PROTEIN: hypothetical protein JCM18902_741 [Psychrobacter sp. JCM 18902]|nr:LOW QUALITY PROTEIN: hypothetical protein JCM18902_741 [Psychrobacter sp. JCM 18902]